LHLHPFVQNWPRAHQEGSRQSNRPKGGVAGKPTVILGLTRRRVKGKAPLARHCARSPEAAPVLVCTLRRTARPDAQQKNSADSRVVNEPYLGIPACLSSARNGRQVQFRAGSSGFVKHSLDTPRHGECVAHISSTGSLMGRILNNPAGAWFNPRPRGRPFSGCAGGWRRQIAFSRARGDRFLQSPSLVTTSTAGLLCLPRISPSRNRSVSSARRWMEAFRLSINWELIAG
jgi:hypothetical protein